MPAFVSLVFSVLLVVLVAMLLKNLTQGSHSGDEAELEKLSKELLGDAGGPDLDLTTPRLRDVACLVVRLPDYSHLIETCEQDELYELLNVFYRVVSQSADSRKGEVSALSGDEIFVVFGRILNVEDPVREAMGAAFEILKQVPAAVLELGVPEGGISGVVVAVTRGPTLSGPLGNPPQRTYGSIGRVPLLAYQIARQGPPGSVVVPFELEAQVSPFFRLEPARDPEHRLKIVVGPRHDLARQLTRNMIVQGPPIKAPPPDFGDDFDDDDDFDEEDQSSPDPAVPAFEGPEVEFPPDPESMTEVPNPDASDTEDPDVAPSPEKFPPEEQPVPQESSAKE